MLITLPLAEVNYLTQCHIPGNVMARARTQSQTFWLQISNLFHWYAPEQPPQDRSASACSFPNYPGTQPQTGGDNPP